MATPFRTSLWSIVMSAGVLVATACQPAAPAASPTSAPKPTEAAKPAAPAGSPVVAQPAASPGAAASPGPAASPGAAASPAAAPAAAKPVAQSNARVDPSLASAFEGKTVTLIVGANPGGGYDTWSRTIARFIGKHLPGNPQVIVQNMDGANHRVATNFIYGAKPDGLTFGMVDRYIPYFQLAGEGPAEGVRYDVTKINWLGSGDTGTQILAMRARDGLTTANLAPLQTGTWRLAQQDPGSSPHLFSALARMSLGWKVKSIFGFAGNPEISLSIQRNETDGMITDSDTQERLLQDQFANGSVVPIVQFGDAKDRPHLKDTPTMMQLLANKSAEDQRLFEVARTPFQWSRPFLAPPGMPENMVSTYRAALWATLQDPEFLAEANRSRLNIIPVPGEVVQDMIIKYLATPKATVDKFNEEMKKDES
ncbi:MAG: Bug family tripartite tricarboxylate transporter substrate binding protein [Chloroflexota bacterium]